MADNIVTVVDYGLGNLFSIERAIAHVGGEVVIAASPDEILRAERLILPGVGAFGEGMANLKERALDEAVRDYASGGRPLLGICLGMQLLMSESEELGLHKGLGIIPGRVVRFPASTAIPYKIPHVGWNGLRVPAGRPDGWAATVLEGLEEGDSMYFVHSYVAVPENGSHVLAETVYGGLTFCSACSDNNIVGVQFHPEKSGEPGLRILKNFLKTGGI